MKLRTVGLTLAAALAAAVGAVAVPVAAWAVPSGYGYVWGYQPAVPAYVAASGYEHNSTGGAITINRIGIGDYQIVFAGLAMPGGIPHASAYGNANSDFCAVAGWGPSGVDEVVRVRCFDGAGFSSDSMFVADVTNVKAGSQAWAYSNIAVPGGWYAPANQYDSSGAAIQVTRIAVGRYLVNLPTLVGDAPGGYYGGYLRATAVSFGPLRCEVLDPVGYAPSYVTPVSCYTIAGALTDATFTISYTRKVNLLGRTPAYGDAIFLPQPLAVPPVLLGWTSSGSGAPTATEIGVGLYEVRFPGLAAKRGHAIANVFSTPPAYCNIVSWWPSLADEVIRVQCYDGGTHLPTPVFGFNVTFTQ